MGMLPSTLVAILAGVSLVAITAYHLAFYGLLLSVAAACNLCEAPKVYGVFPTMRPNLQHMYAGSP